MFTRRQGNRCNLHADERICKHALRCARRSRSVCAPFSKSPSIPSHGIGVPTTPSQLTRGEGPTGSRAHLRTRARTSRCSLDRRCPLHPPHPAQCFPISVWSTRACSPTRRVPHLFAHQTNRLGGAVQLLLLNFFNLSNFNNVPIFSNFYNVSNVSNFSNFSTVSNFSNSGAGAAGGARGAHTGGARARRQPPDGRGRARRQRRHGHARWRPAARAGVM